MCHQIHWQIQGGTRYVPLSSGSKFFNLHGVFGKKKLQKIIALWELAPPPRKILDPQLRLIKHYYSNDDDIKLTNCYFPDKRYQVEDPYKVRHMFYASIRKNKVAVYSHKGVILCFPGSVHKMCPGSIYFCFILYTGALTDL